MQGMLSRIYSINDVVLNITGQATSFSQLPALVVVGLCVVHLSTLVITSTLHLGVFLWRSAKPTGSAKPAARYGHSALIYKKSLYVLLGQDSESDYSDIWTVNIKGTLPLYHCKEQKIK